jgi:hypothetical protein
MAWRSPLRVCRAECPLADRRSRNEVNEGHQQNDDDSHKKSNNELAHDSSSRTWTTYARRWLPVCHASRSFRLSWSHRKCHSIVVELSHLIYNRNGR